MLDKLTIELTFKKNTNYLSFKKNGLLTFPAVNSSPGSYLRAGYLIKSEWAASATDMFFQTWFGLNPAICLYKRFVYFVFVSQHLSAYLT